MRVTKYANNRPIICFYFVVVLIIYFYLLKKNPKVVEIKDTYEGEEGLLNKMNFDCQKILNGTYDENSKNFTFNSRIIEDEILYAPDRCLKIKEMFHFPEDSQSEEEAKFPLAYGILVYKEISQVLFMLSSIYQPQNEYCFAVGDNSKSLFRSLLKDLSNCLPNVHFMPRPPIHWGSHEIINSVYTCMEFMSHLKSDWKYFQYLSGVDVPIKTNYEMVQIFKALNGMANVEITQFQKKRLNGKNLTSLPYTLFKSSLSGLIPRSAANKMASSTEARTLLELLKGTSIADEGFWATMLANKETLDIPGSIDGNLWIESRGNATKKSAAHEYYISRFQLWEYKQKECKGFLSASSCVFGVRDLPYVLRSKALVAHKFYLSNEPSAYFCALKEIRRRTKHPDKNFDTSFYEQLPQVEISRGVAYENITHPEWML